MIKKGIDKYGAEYKRTPMDFTIKKLEQDNCVCSVCHGTGAVLSVSYVTRNYESAINRGKICKNLQAHGHSLWICRECLDNFRTKAKGVLENEVQI